jgi:uncharacterized membrane protein YoaK (UPF0700 family)
MIQALPRWIVIGAFILAFIAGMVNSLALLSIPHLAVSHMTGAVGMLSESILEQNEHTQALLMILAGFFVGAILSGLIVGHERLAIGRRYGFALLLQSIILLGATGAYHASSVWGPCLGAMACGLQNAMVSTYSGATIRTTHLTGVISDLGSMVGNVLRGNSINRRHLILLIEILSGFILGTLATGLLYSSIGPRVLIIPASLCALCGAAYLVWRLQGRIRRNLG